MYHLITLYYLLFFFDEYSFNGNLLQFSATGLTPNTTYYFRVAAINNVGQGNYSTIVAVTTLPLSESFSAQYLKTILTFVLQLYPLMFVM